MFTIIVNGREHRIRRAGEKGIFEIDGMKTNTDVVRLNDSTWHLLLDQRSYTVEIVSSVPAEKKITVRVNNNMYDVQLRDPYDELLHRLGMDAAAMHKINDLKAPMPGLVVAVHVEPGQAVKAGDLLVTLEAMKMENTLKAAGDGTVMKINVRKGQAVEKNEVLVFFS